MSINRAHADSGNDRADTCVAVLLSTFNGERYLNEQLASFTAQSHTNWLLYWRDDGSSDGTVALMTDFASGPGAGRVQSLPSGSRLRPTGSFMALLRSALDGPADCFAFADQDDVWLPDKLAHGVAALSGLSSDRPGLYFCGRALVGPDLSPAGQVLAPRRAPGFPAALTQNLAPGCCMILNRAAAATICSAPVPDGTWHDWWAYLAVSATGGMVIAGGTPDILYRQHGLNLVGEPRGFRHRFAGAVRRGRSPFMTLFWRQAEALSALPLSPAARAQLRIIGRGKGNPGARLMALRLPGFRRQTWAETALFRLWFLLG